VADRAALGEGEQHDRDRAADEEVSGSVSHQNWK
jgi:hypothetical protein